MPKDTTSMQPYESSLPGRHTHMEGITVVGEAVRRVAPERAEFTIEVGASAPGAGQALRDARTRAEQLTQTLSALGVQTADVQTVSVNVYNLYAPAAQAMIGYAGMPPMTQIGQGGLGPLAAATPEVQFGSYHARTTLRITVRDPSRAGEIVDNAIRAGGMLASGFFFKAADEAQAQRAVLEAAGKDARAKAETLAAAAGKQVGEPVAISEDLVACNGAYAALRAAFPLAFGAGAPPATGELEYYARVSAAFRLQ